MKPLYKAIHVSSFIFVVSATPLLAQPYSLDENGNGTTMFQGVNPPVVSPLPFAVASDPTGGITNSPVLIYSLEFPVVSGDVALTNTDGTVADLLRFFTPSGGGNSFVIFYSQINDPNHTLADVGIPYTANPATISAVSPTTTWYPGFSNLPGFPASPFPTWDRFEYYFITGPAPPVSVSGTNLIWAISGPTNLQFYVVATTNLLLPLTNWTSLSTNQFDLSGRCVLTLPMEADKPCRFYRVRYHMAQRLRGSY